MTALEKIKEVSAFLESKGIEDSLKEAEIIVTHCFGIDKAALYRDNPVVPEKAIKEIENILQRRAQREPLQYIIGHVEFLGLKIKVGKGVLIPRPETELLAEETIKAISNQLSAMSKENALRVLDLCTGSGCLALAIAKNLPDADVYGTDISKEAIRYASENAKLNDVKNVTFLKGSLFEPLTQLISNMPLKFDVIVSNPPYIKSHDILDLEPEISKWEPKNALDGGENGLRYYRDILSDARKYLMPGGFIFLEIGEAQADDVAGIAVQNGFCNISVIKDYAGLDRVLRITR